jgi:CRP/FNR family transcriptional regulator, cyclic AMP receptor protein
VRFSPVLRRRPELCIRLLELLCERLRRTDQQVEDLLIRHFESRLARTLLRLGQEHGLREHGAVRIDLSLSQTELANLAGGTRESVNRHLHSLERLGVIALKGSRIVIRNAEALEQLG